MSEASASAYEESILWRWRRWRWRWRCAGGSAPAGGRCLRRGPSGGCWRRIRSRFQSPSVIYFFLFKKVYLKFNSLLRFFPRLSCLNVVALGRHHALRLCLRVRAERGHRVRTGVSSQPLQPWLQAKRTGEGRAAFDERQGPSKFVVDSYQTERHLDHPPPRSWLATTTKLTAPSAPPPQKCDCCGVDPIPQVYFSCENVPNVDICSKCATMPHQVSERASERRRRHWP